MSKMTNRELEELYESGSSRLTQERNDFLLPQILDFVKDRRWINLHPEYQRRQVWDRSKKSLFIESLLMNLPVPPVFLFEWDYNRYEVIDGQQRLSAITDFYSNQLKLTGLEVWSGLNGKKYAELPPKVQRGLDRRRISAVVLLAENLRSEDPAHSIRRMMFERLNTGGLNLQAQELRNSIYASSFNDMLLRLAGNRLFDEIWEIPPYEDHITGGVISPELASNSLFKRMRDCEIVLRFFAFRKKSHIRGAVKTMLDRCMEEHLADTPEEVGALERDFIGRLELCHGVFGANTFRLPPNDQGERKLSWPLYDAVMIAADRLYADKDAILRARDTIGRELDAAFSEPEFYELVVARANTADAIKGRLNAVEKIFAEAL